VLELKQLDFRIWWIIQQQQFQQTTEEYDGSAWTAGGNLNTARQQLAGCGTQTAGLAFGGFTTVNPCNAQKNMMVQLGQLVQILATARSYLAGAGTQTAGL
jgi:hypothetical protein